MKLEYKQVLLVVVVFEEPAPNLSQKFVIHVEMLPFEWLLENFKDILYHDW